MQVINSITIVVHALSLVPRDLGDDAMPAAKRFAEKLREEIEQHWPEADVTITVLNEKNGDFVSDNITVLSIDGREMDTDDVEAVYMSVWEDGASELWPDAETLGKRLAADVAAAESLEDLAELLNNAVDAGLHVDRIPGLDMAALPTFGGPEPDDTRGIYSWDAERFLAPDGDPDAPWALFDREDAEPVEVEAAWFAEEIQDVCAASEWLDENGLDGDETLTVHPDGSIGVDGGGSIVGTHETYRLCVEAIAEDEDDDEEFLLIIETTGDMDLNDRAAADLMIDGLPPLAEDHLAWDWSGSQLRMRLQGAPTAGAWLEIEALEWVKSVRAGTDW